MQSTVKPVKLKKCKACRDPFIPTLPLQSVCNWECAKVLIEIMREKAKAMDAKVARTALKEGRVALKSRKDHEGEAKSAVQLYARLRDTIAGLGCVSCGKPANWNGIWHGSHYMQAGSRSATRYNLWNINKACNQCNIFKGGAPTSYRVALITKIGLNKVEWLEQQTHVVKHSIEYMQRIKRIFNRKARILKKRLASLG